MSGILVVCTGNVCRSPIAEGLLRARLAERLGQGAPAVASAGTAGWEGSGADPYSVEAAAERGADISGHRGRRLLPQEALTAGLVIAMAREHADAVREHAPERTFTLKELVRLLEQLPPPGQGESDALFASRVRDADALRHTSSHANPYDEDVMDPLGMPLDSFRAVAWELDDLCARLVEGLFGRAPVHLRSAGRGG